MTFEIKKSSSNYDIVDSGILFSYSLQGPIKLDLNSEQGFAFSLEFVFETNSNKKSDLKISVDNDQNLIKFTCVNFDNSLGTGTTQPLELGEHNNKKIYIHFWGYSLGQNSAKKIEYCLFMER